MVNFTFLALVIVLLTYFLMSYHFSLDHFNMAHKPINCIDRIFEFGIKRGAMLPSSGHIIRPLRSEYKLQEMIHMNVIVKSFIILTMC